MATAGAFSLMAESGKVPKAAPLDGENVVVSPAAHIFRILCALCVAAADILSSKVLPMPPTILLKALGLSMRRS